MQTKCCPSLIGLYDLIVVRLSFYCCDEVVDFCSISQYQFISSPSMFLSTLSAGVNRQDLEVQTVADTDAITEMISWCIDASTLFIESGNPSYMAKGIINHCRL